MPHKVLIRCDAAPAIGFGHAVRCLALADALRDQHDCEVSFAMLQGPQGVAQVYAQGYAVHQPPAGAENLEEGDWLKELITNHQQEVLILDVRTDLSTTAVRTIRATGVLIVTIDDPSNRRILADLAFYPPVPQVERLDWTGFTGKRFVGWDWVVLRPQSAEAPRRARPRAAESMAGPPSADRRLNLLVTMGGSDPAGLTLMALEAIEKIDGNFHVQVVIGGGFMHESALVDWLASAKRTYEIRRNVTDMASLIGEADLAVASFGVTAYELAAMGVPAIYLCLTHDHAESCKAFTGAEMGISLGEYPNVTTRELSKGISSLLMNPKNRCAMSERGSKLVDGLGVERVAAEITKLNTSCSSN